MGQTREDERRRLGFGLTPQFVVVQRPLERVGRDFDARMREGGKKRQESRVMGALGDQAVK